MRLAPHHTVFCALALGLCTCTGEGPGATGESSTSSSSDSASSSTSGSGSESESDDSSWLPEDEGSETEAPPSLDEAIAELIADQPIPVVPLEPLPAQDPSLVALGEALFFDPILSGAKDTACASCHHPAWGSSDGLSLALGTGAVGVGPERAEGSHPPFVPRHSMALFNIGDPRFTSMFWDGRVELDEEGQLRTPLDPGQLPPGLDGPLAAQALFPLLDRLEMRGEEGSQTVLDEANELGMISDEDPVAIWTAVMLRLGAIPAYVDLFAAAYPELSFAELSIADAANAIAAYEREVFAFPNSPWDAYLDGDLLAISDAAKLGAILFYGAAGCATCHAGPLLSDQRFHSTGVPQLGPGQTASAPFDHGRELAIGDPEQRFAFRTPSLRNVAVSPPYMHDGALVDFQQTLVHYANPADSIEKLNRDLLLPELALTVQDDPVHLAELAASLSDDLPLDPSFVGLSNLREFLETLTDPAVAELPSTRPDSVPSGLPVP